MLNALGTGNLVRVDGELDGAKYRAILEETLLEAAKDFKLGQRFTFRSGNGLKHPARSTMERFGSKHVSEWPSQSPGLNPTENLWQDWKVAVHRRSQTCLTECELLYKKTGKNFSP